MEKHQIEEQPFLIEVGDWICKEGKFGQVTQIYHEYYEEYSDFTAWNAGGKNVGDYKETWAILKYFCTEKKVRHNTTGYTRIRPSTSPIVEGDTRGWWDLIQKFIKENPKEYLAYQEYKPQMLEDHIHVGYFVGPRLGNSKHTKEYFIDLIAKIENRAGVDNIDEICKVADGIMVARGDLGVEIPFVEVPAIQKYLIKKCRLLGKRVITATEMLESMIQNPRPTRAEISDVANAVYDGSSAVMLSGETAAGKYPVEAVRNMAEIAEFTERSIDYKEWFRTTEFRIRSNADAVSHSTCSMAIDVGAKCIIVNSRTGQTARMVSRFRCPVDIVGMTTEERAWRKLNLSWGVTPALSEEFDSVEVMFYHALKRAREVKKLVKGDTVVMTGGQISGAPGSTNIIKLETIK